MPHKRQKRSIRLATQSSKGYNNPPTASDSLLPIASTSYHGEPIALDPNAGVGGGTGVGPKKDNKRRKPTSATTAGAGSSRPSGGGDLNGMSKSAYRILNAEKLRQEYHAEKKRKLDEEEAAKNPSQKKKKASAAANGAKPALQPLPYESLSTFNRRVEHEMRATINQTIQASKNVAKKTKEALKDKKLKAKKTEVADDVDEEWNGIEEGGSTTAHEDGTTTPKYGKEKKEKPTPEESRDPFAKPPKRPKPTDDDDAKDGDGGNSDGRLPRGRTGKTEFDSAPLARGLKQVVLAPPNLAKPARKGLLAKALSSASDGTTTTAGARLSSAAVAAGAADGGFAGLRLAGMDEPVGKNRLPVDPIMKAMLDREREKAVRMYRELKEQRFADKAS